MERVVTLAGITRLEELRGNLFILSFESRDIASRAVCGQFVHIKCSEALYLRRPISIFSVEGDIVTVVFEVKGAGTKALSEKKAGDVIDVLGPLGNGFSLDRFEGKKIMLVGGGIGIFPLYPAAKRFGKNAVAVLGFRTASLAALTDEFAAQSHVILVSDDGTLGEKGFVTDGMKSQFRNGLPDAVFACGPKPMLKGVAQLCAEHGVFCEVSLEERMGCGMGACLCCVTPVRVGDTVENLTVCRYGPVFNAKEVF